MLWGFLSRNIENVILLMERRKIFYKQLANVRKYQEFSTIPGTGEGKGDAAVFEKSKRLVVFSIFTRRGSHEITTTQRVNDDDQAAARLCQSTPNNLEQELGFIPGPWDDHQSPLLPTVYTEIVISHSPP